MTFLIILGIILTVIILIVLLTILLLPWMDHWGTPMDELPTDLPGDDLVSNPPRVTNRSVVINTTKENIYPWLVQMGADKAGLYSYTWLENLVGCRMAKVEVIRDEWQNPQPGDLMKMCAKNPAPPPYEIARVVKNEAVIFYHHDEDVVADSWAFILLPLPDGRTRLLSRTRTTMIGGFWEVIRPISFKMERKMLLTIKKLAENNPVG